MEAKSMNGRDVLIYLSLKYQGEYERVKKAIHDRESFTPEEAEAALKKVTCSTLDDA
jgi:hypothetical protein